MATRSGFVIMKLDENGVEVIDWEAMHPPKPRRHLKNTKAGKEPAFAHGRAIERATKRNAARYDKIRVKDASWEVQNETKKVNFVLAVLKACAK